MTLIFGNLVESFVRFGIILSEEKSGSATAQEQLPAAAAAFRHDAAKDAATLVYIGESSAGYVFSSLVGVAVFLCTFVYMTVWVSNGEASSKRLRERYLQAVLRQDIVTWH
jgi:ATP-binding cassette, subfamily B (MDR/TAP), member 1